MYKLATGWKLIRLGDTGTWLSGGTPRTGVPHYWNGDIPWISAASLKDFRISDSNRRITKLGALAGARLVPAGSVIFVVRGMSLKSELRVGVAQREVAFGQDCKAIVPSSGIDGTFLGLAVMAKEQEVLCMVDEAGHGTGRLPTDLMSRLDIAVPPLGEQRRIAEILDAVDDEVAASENLIRKLTLIVEGLRPPFPEHEAARPLGELASVSAGLTLGAEPDGASSVELPYLRVANVQDGHIDTSEMKAVRVLRTQVGRFQLAAGDVLLTEGGDYDKLGRGAVWDGRITPCLHQNHIFRVRCRDRVLHPEFLALYAASPAGRRQFLAIAKQSTNLASINSTQLKAVTIPVPDFAVQEQVVAPILAVRERLKAENIGLAKLRLFKEGLAEDLLTGRVRVTRSADMLANR